MNFSYYREFKKVYRKARRDFPAEEALDIAKFITHQEAIDEREGRREHGKDKRVRRIENLILQPWKV